MLKWDKPNERYYEHGLDRGVLYVGSKAPVVWNGLVGFDEGSEGGATSVLYRDGIVYLADADASDFSGKMTAIYFPDEFNECLGMPIVADGMIVDSQKPKRFSFSYRTLIGNGSSNDRFGYELHLVYNAVASVDSRERKSVGSSTDPVQFNINIVCTPVQLTGYRPSAHYIIDTRYLAGTSIGDIEKILYGDGVTPGRLPTPDELYDLLNFGDSITFETFTHPILGECWVASGSYKNVHFTSSTTWEILNVNGTKHGDGTYTLSDTP